MLFRFVGLFFLFGLSFCFAGFAPAEPVEVPRREWARFVEGFEGDGPPLLVSFPAHGLVVRREQVRFAGAVPPGTEVTVNGVAARVYGSGAFVGVAPLREGANPLVFRATLRGKSTAEERAVVRPPSARLLPKCPLRIREDEGLWPRGRQELLPGDELVVRFEGSPGAAGWFTIGSDQTVYPMVERDGVYEGKLTIRAGHLFDNASVVVHIDDGVFEEPPLENHKRAFPLKVPAVGGRLPVIASSVQVPCSLTTLPEKVRRSVYVTADDTGIYTDETTWYRLTSVPAGTGLLQTGRRDHLVRVRLNDVDEHWVYSRFVREASAGEPWPMLNVAEFAGGVDPGGNGFLQIDLDDFSRCVASSVETSAEGGVLLWSVFGVAPVSSGSLNLLGVLEGDFVRSVEPVEAESGHLLLRVILNTERCWGYDLRMERGRVVLWLKKAPVLYPDVTAPLRGARVVLDPGHGGTDSGAVGPAGVWESDVNLALSLRLKAMLLDAGGDVVLTRSGDEERSLEQRIALVQGSGGDVFLSIHSNSIPGWKDPLDFSGPLSFRYHQKDVPLAHLVQRSLAEGLGGAFRKRDVRYHFFRPIRRCTQMPSVLTEVLFLSNPEDEMRLLDPTALDSLADSLYKGIVQYLEHQDVVCLPPEQMADDRADHLPHKSFVKMKSFPEED